MPNSNNNELDVQKEYDLNSILSESDLSNEDKEDLKKKFNELLACIDCLDSTQLQEDLLKEEKGARKLNALVFGSFASGTGVITSKLAESKTNTVKKLESKKEDIENTNKKFLSVIFDEFEELVKDIDDTETIEKMSNLLLSKIYEKEQEFNHYEKKAEKTIEVLKDQKYFEYSLEKLRKKNFLTHSYIKFKKNIKEDNGVSYKIYQINNDIKKSYDTLHQKLQTTIRDGEFNDPKQKKAFISKFNNVEKKAKITQPPTKGKYTDEEIEEQAKVSSKFVYYLMCATIIGWPWAQSFSDSNYKFTKKMLNEKNEKYLEKEQLKYKKQPNIEEAKQGFDELIEEAKKLSTIFDKDIEDAKDKLTILDREKNSIQQKKNTTNEQEAKNEIKEWEKEFQKKINRKTKKLDKLKLIKDEEKKLKKILNSKEKKRSKLIEKITTPIQNEKNKIEGKYLMDVKITKVEKDYLEMRQSLNRQNIDNDERSKTKRYHYPLSTLEGVKQLEYHYGSRLYLRSVDKEKGVRYFALRINKGNDVNKNMGINIEEEYKHQKKKQIENLSKNKQEFLANKQEAQQKSEDIGKVVKKQQEKKTPSERKHNRSQSLHIPKSNSYNIS